MNVQKRNNLSLIEHFQGSYPCEFFHPLGICDCLFRNTFYGDKYILIQTRKIFHFQGNYFADE